MKKYALKQYEEFLQTSFDECDHAAKLEEEVVNSGEEFVDFLYLPENMCKKEEDIHPLLLRMIRQRAKAEAFRLALDVFEDMRQMPKLSDA